MNPELLKACFFLGVMVAEYVHGLKRDLKDPKTDEIFETLKAVGCGELTLMDTPEEVISSLPTAPTEVSSKRDWLFRQMIRIGRQNQRIAAQEILATNPDKVF